VAEPVEQLAGRIWMMRWADDAHLHPGDWPEEVAPIAAIIEADRAAVREECLRRVLGKVDKAIDGCAARIEQAEPCDVDLEVEDARYAAYSKVRKWLLFELSTPSPKGQAK
jgi:chromosome segregation and condensation protein ScpB